MDYFQSIVRQKRLAKDRLCSLLFVHSVGFRQKRLSTLTPVCPPWPRRRSWWCPGRYRRLRR